MELPLFTRRSTCTACSLHETARSAGIPMRYVAGPPSAEVAVVFVGTAPGVDEDAKGEHWTGKAAEFLHSLYLQYHDLARRVCVYAGNIIRCRIPDGADPQVRQLNTCGGYLAADVSAVCARHPRVALVCCSSPACKYVFGCTQKESFQRQGQRREDGVTLFSTYNPGILMEGNDPAKLTAIGLHLDLLSAWVATGKLPEALVPPPVEYGVRWGAVPSLAAVDDETYGAVHGFPLQTSFNPRVMVMRDGVRAEQIVRTVALAWREDGRLRTSLYRRANPVEWAAFRENIGRATRLVGHNIGFDVKTLRACDDELPLRTFDCQLLDTSIASYWHSDQKPERSLKDLCKLFGIYVYRFNSLKDGFRYESDDDPTLHEYNCVDAAATLMLWERLESLTLANAPGTCRFSPPAIAWWSDVLWMVLLMEEEGVAMDRPHLQGLRGEYTAKLDRMADSHAQRYGPRAEAFERRWLAVWERHRRTKRRHKLTKKRLEPLIRDVLAAYGARLRGQGSPAYATRLYTEAAQIAGVLEDRRLGKLKDGSIQTTRDNAQLLLGLLADGPVRDQIAAMEDFARTEKLLGSYVEPLLDEYLQPDGRVYPSYYIVPARSESGADGGTPSGRFSANHPAVQTFPEDRKENGIVVLRGVEEAITSRYRPGVLLHADYAAMELRTVAFLAGDDEWLAKFDTPGYDPHADTASLLFGVPITQVTRDQRQVGKTINFLILYGGGAQTLMETLRRKCGVIASRDQCQAWIDQFWRVRPKIAEFQRGWLREVDRVGYLELAPVGVCRTFIMERSSDNYHAIIVNTPVQAHATLVLKSAQVEFRKWVIREGLSSRVHHVRDVHDAMDVDTVPDLEDVVTSAIRKVMLDNPYRTVLESLHGRRLPLAVDIKSRRFAPEGIAA